MVVIFPLPWWEGVRGRGIRFRYEKDIHPHPNPPPSRGRESNKILCRNFQPFEEVSLSRGAVARQLFITGPLSAGEPAIIFGFASFS
jgi:hypothetical protein